MNYKKLKLFIIASISALFFGSCVATEPDSQSAKASQATSVRFLVTPNTAVANINLYAFTIPTPGDTVFYRSLGEVTGTALSSPVNISLPMGKYVIVALANVDARITSPTPSVTRIDDLMATLGADAINTGMYTPAGEWMLGVASDVEIGIQSSIMITLKRIVGRVAIEYLHADPFLTHLQWSVEGVSPKAYYNGNFAPMLNQGVSVVRDITPPMANTLRDSMLMFPSVNSSTTLHLTHTRTIAGTTTSKTYENLLSLPIRSNYITRLTINRGESTNINVSEEAWSTESKMIILDESPNPDINMGLGDFTTDLTDTAYLQSIDISVSVNQGIPTNYKNSFLFTIEKIAPTTGSVAKNVKMKVVGNNLVTTTAVPLSRGTYILRNYKLTDIEGTLPDPSGLSTPKTFTVGLDHQTVSVTLDGRQAVDNALLKQVSNALHGTGQTDGSIFPGTSRYNTLPLGSTLPATGAGISYSAWYVNSNNYVQKIPIRGEWRAYNIVYRGVSGQSKLNGTLPTQLAQLTQLTSIDLRLNALSGGLPLMTGLTVLNTLILNGNTFSGNIDNLASLKLSRLSLENNSFTGAITTGLAGSTTSLTYISLNSNGFTGSLSVIPIGVGNIFVQYNYFSGQMPAFVPAIGNIAAQCDFRYNSLSCYSSSVSPSIVPGRVNPQRNSVNITVCP